MRLPSGSSIGSATASTSRWMSAVMVAASRSPSAPTSLICWRAAAMAEAMRASLFVMVDEARLGGRAGGSGAEDGGCDAQARGAGGVAGLVLAGGDLAGDRAELGGDRRLAGLDALERVEDQVVLGTAWGEEADDVLQAAAADVGDVGLHAARPRAGSGGTPDALLKAGLHPGQVEVHDDRGVLEVVALAGDGAEAEDGELAGLEGVLEALERGRVDRAVGDVGLDAVALAQRSRELAQAVDALGEHEHLPVARDRGDRLGGDAAQQGQAVAATAHCLADEALLGERLGERGAAVGQRLGVDGGVDEHIDIRKHDGLRA